VRNKAVGVDNIAAELLKNGGPNLVDALHAVIQQAWTSETPPRSWTEGVCAQCIRRAINSIVKLSRDLPLEREIQSLRPKFYATAFCPTLTWPFSITQAGFQSGKSLTDQLFALRHILEKCNEFNITTHHLFI
jgi:hypothetical protein